MGVVSIAATTSIRFKKGQKLMAIALEIIAEYLKQALALLVLTHTLINALIDLVAKLQPIKGI